MKNAILIDSPLLPELSIRTLPNDEQRRTLPESSALQRLPMHVRRFVFSSSDLELLLHTADHGAILKLDMIILLLKLPGRPSSRRGERSLGRRDTLLLQKLIEAPSMCTHPLT